MIAAHSSRKEELKLPSDRSFGFTLSAVFTLIGVVSLVTGRGGSYGALAAACLFGVLAAMKPAALHRANVVWARFGLVLHHVVNPVVLAILFFAVLAPFGILARMLGKNPLQLKFTPHADSYWVQPDENTPGDKRMINQF